jgi:hypothetical protein
MLISGRSKEGRTFEAGVEYQHGQGIRILKYSRKEGGKEKIPDYKVDKFNRFLPVIRQPSLLAHFNKMYNALRLW